MSSETQFSHKDAEKFAGKLVEWTREDATGSKYDDGDVHVGNSPRNIFFSGSLTPGGDVDDIEADSDEIYSRISPSAVHMIISAEIKDDKSLLRIIPSFDFYYRVFPAYDSSSAQEPHFKKKEMRDNTLTLEVPSGADTGKIDSDITEKLRDQVSEALQEVSEQEMIYRDSERAEEIIERLQNDGFEDEEEYKEAIEEIGGEKKLPRIQPGIEANIVEKGDENIVIRLVLQNRSPENDDYELKDNGMYNSSLKVDAVQGIELRPFEFEQLPEDYRWNREIAGYGVNCTVVGTEDGLKTTCIPTHTQYHYQHNTPEREEAKPKLEDLAEDPLPTLRALKSEMESYNDTVWEDKIRRLENGDEKEEIVQSAKDNREKFEKEIEQFGEGISLLSQHEDAKKAFRLMNEAFKRKVTEDGEMEYDEWRLFQIIFIVSNILDVLAREKENIEGRSDEVSLIWFPTGGGKTEAYLGLTIFAALFDRMRGKEIGSTAFMRYPLKLLSLQQFHRVVESFMYADQIRREEELGGDQFSVGYLTGGTENKMRDLVKNQVSRGGLSKNDVEQNKDYLDELTDKWQENDLQGRTREKHTILNKCPVCDGSVEVSINKEKCRIEHICTNEQCDWDRIPIYVVDNEIYRYLPTMVVGTQDKLGALGYERKFRQLVGHVEEECPTHGYHDGTECTETYFCDEEPDSMIDLHPRDPVPGLQIQDELHLIKEELGTFESHYWSLMQKLIEWKDYEEPKVIAATATIEEYQNQVQHLYLKKGRRFPAPGPDYRDSFYASRNEEKTQRIFMGITPWNRSHINTVASLLKHQQKIIQDMLQDPEKEMQNFEFEEVESVDDFKNLLLHYQTSVTYVISKMEGARIFQSVETQINEDLTREGYEGIDRFELTGSTGFSEVSDMLDRFESLGDEISMEEAEDLIVSTSSISHGVDLDVLNHMIFFGMPRRSAEYIQASSRVGRKHPGIVIDCFHPIRERDRSHFHYFDKYHEYLDRLVEPVPVNRWAKFSADRTLPGLFMGLVLQKNYSEIRENHGSPYRASEVRKAIQANEFSKEDVVEDLKEVYGQDWRDLGESPFSSKIESFVRKSFSGINNLDGDGGWTSNSLPRSAMTSLRDTDEDVEITLSRKEGHIAENIFGGEE
jgi:superfamily II DNA/RNA helicase